MSSGRGGGELFTGEQFVVLVFELEVSALERIESVMLTRERKQTGSEKDRGGDRTPGAQLTHAQNRCAGRWSSAVRSAD